MKPSRTGFTLTAAELLSCALAARAPAALAAAAIRLDFSRNCLRLIESLADM